MRTPHAGLTLLAALSPLAATAQTGSPGIHEVFAREQQALAAPVFGTGTFAPQAQERKCPAVAGLLSFVVPFGTGSFYAGNKGHGNRHLGIAVGTLAVSVIAAASAPDSCDAACGEFGVAVLGLTAFMLNWAVGTVVAVIDAGQTNRSLQASALRLQPQFELLTPSSASPLRERSRPRIGLQLVRLSF
jgi:hypothetical protein